MAQIPTQTETTLITAEPSGVKSLGVVDFVWCTEHDPWLGTTYFISKGGELLECSDEGIFSAARLNLALIATGLPKSKRRTFCKVPPRLEDIRSTAPRNKATLESRVVTPFDRYHRINRSDIVSSAAEAIDHYLKYVEIDAELGSYSQQQVVEYCNEWLITKNSEDCLYTALNQFGICNAFGIDARLVLGGFFPTRKMHAWVELDGKPIFDHMEEVKHFKPLFFVFSDTK